MPLLIDCYGYDGNDREELGITIGAEFSRYANLVGNGTLSATAVWALGLVEVEPACSNV